MVDLSSQSSRPNKREQARFRQAVRVRASCAILSILPPVDWDRPQPTGSLAEVAQFPAGELLAIQLSRTVRDWDSKPGHQRAMFQFIPTYSSWLNVIEVLFNLVQAKVLRRARFPSKRDLVAKPIEYIEQFNQEGGGVSVDQAR